MTEDGAQETGRSKAQLVRMTEAADILGISVRATYRLVADGQLPPPVKIGRASRMVLAEGIGDFFMAKSGQPRLCIFMSYDLLTQIMEIQDRDQLEGFGAILWVIVSVGVLGIAILALLIMGR